MRVLEAQSASNAMNVLMLVSSISRSSGGVGASVQSMARQIQGGCAVNVLALRDAFSDEDSKAWLPVVPMIFDQKGPRSFGYSSDLHRHLQEQDADLIHCHGIWMYPSTVGRAIARRRHVPLVVSPHGMLDPWALQKARWKKRVAGWLFENRNLHAAACIHALCESEYQSIRDYGLSNPVAIIPNGIDVPARAAESSPPWAKIVSPEKRVLLFLGRIDRKKNVHGLIEAWRGLCDDHRTNEWVLVIAGWTRGDAAEYERHMRQQVADLSLADSVVFTGALYEEEKAVAFEHADGFVLPSYSEGLPMAVLEAWSYALPVLMTAECNIPAGFAAGAAVEIEPALESIKRGLTCFLSLSENERREIGRKGRQLVETRFTWSKVAAEMMAVYRWLAGDGPQPACVRLN